MQFDQTAHQQGARSLIIAKQIQQNCNNPTVVKEKLSTLFWELDTMYEYQIHISENFQLEDAISNTKMMTTMVEKMYDEKASPSYAYCSKNTDMLIMAINSIMEITGRKQ